MGSIPVNLNKMQHGRSLARFIDHTFLKPDGSLAGLEAAITEATHFNCIGFCTHLSFLKRSIKALEGTNTLPVCVVGFPHSTTHLDVKLKETELACTFGAKEIDFVMPIWAVKSDQFELVEAEISAVVGCAAPNIVKIIIETCLLTKPEIVMGIYDAMNRLGNMEDKSSTAENSEGNA